ncbi:MAG: hypothetical protein H8E98_06200 [Bacteroidetes bacterium]|nr:hypothetical protein [Bacteroidota bacterium]
MKKSELRKIIKEEIKLQMNEANLQWNDPDVPLGKNFTKKIWNIVEPARLSFLKKWYKGMESKLKSFTIKLDGKSYKFNNIKIDSSKKAHGGEIYAHFKVDDREVVVSLDISATHYIKNKKIATKWSVGLICYPRWKNDVYDNVRMHPPVKDLFNNTDFNNILNLINPLVQRADDYWIKKMKR